MLRLGPLEDGPGANESDTGRDALDDATRFSREQDEQRRAKRDQDMCPQARCLSGAFALRPEQCAEQRRAAITRMTTRTT